MAKLIKNMARCLTCGGTIESRHRHDFKWCGCGKLAVDGGLAYTKRSLGGPYEELSEYEEEDGTG